MRINVQGVSTSRVRPRDRRYFTLLCDCATDLPQITTHYYRETKTKRLTKYVCGTTCCCQVNTGWFFRNYLRLFSRPIRLSNKTPTKKKTNEFRFVMDGALNLCKCVVLTVEKEIRQTKKVCQKWDSNPRPQSGLRPERSALDRSAILTFV